MHKCARKLAFACKGGHRHTDATALVWGSEGTLPVSILAFQLLWDSFSSLLHKPGELAWDTKNSPFSTFPSLQIHAGIIDTYVQTLKIFNFDFYISYISFLVFKNKYNRNSDNL